MPLSLSTRQIIWGSLLGDGSLALNPNFKNARFSFKHSTKQKEYFFWKVGQLKEIASKKSVWLQGVTKPDGFGQKKLRFQSQARPELTEIFRRISQNGHKRVMRKWLNQLTPLSLAVWWMDDGSLIGNSRKGVLCTDGFSLKEVNLIVRYLKKVWQIKTVRGRINRGEKVYFRVYIRAVTQLEKFLRIIIPFLPVEQMLPKVLLLYKDDKLQKRWTSEVVRLSHFNLSVIQRYLNLKRRKWQLFRG